MNIQYTGTVKVSIKDKESYHIREVVHNSATDIFLTSILRAITGNFSSAEMPIYIDAYSDDIATKSVLSYSPNIAGLVKSDVDNANQQAAYFTGYIPYSAIESKNTKISSVALLNYAKKQLATIKLASSIENISEGQAIIIEWKITLSNATSNTTTTSSAT